jgi:serine/threonine protein kinase/formylglycine-generating enzyme required for sulfatase activity
MLDAPGAKQFGKYELIAEIGRGAFGIVYKAKDSVLGRYVAIKVLHPALLVDPGFIERFRHEARVAALLDHPNIVPVYDFGQEDGRYFLVMAYMPGGSLSTLIENAAPMPAERVIKITKEIGAGLSYSHASNIIHRDLKPSNILFDDKGVARVSDMGFAKVREGGGAASMTASGQLVGTPSYMSPEVWKGKPATEASDVYSLGLISMEMFTGAPFFDGESTPEIMLKHFQPRVIPELIPAELHPVMAKALAENPEERYADIPSYLSQLAQPALTVESASSPVESALEWELKHFGGPVPQAESDTPEPALDHVDTRDTRDTRGTQARKAQRKWVLPALIGVLSVILLALILVFVGNNRKAQQAIHEATQNAIAAQNATNETQASQPIFALEATPTEAEPTATALPTNTPEPSETLEATATEEPTLNPTPKPTLDIGSTMVREKDGMTMVYVPAGEFLMGNPTRTETTGEYWIDQTEVTVAMYKKCVEEGVCSIESVANDDVLQSDDYYDAERYQNYPAINITWQEADQYCIWAGGRLPTEIEWEKAGRGINGKRFPWGDYPSYSAFKEVARIGDLMPVKFFEENVSDFGLNDMVGNAQEWVNTKSKTDRNFYAIKSIQLLNGINVDRSERSAGDYLVESYWDSRQQRWVQVAPDSSLHLSIYRLDKQRSPIRGFRCVYDVDSD